MDEKVVVEILGKDVSASKVLGEVGSKLTSFAKGAGIAIAAGLGIGTAALTKFSVDLVDMGSDAGETLNLIQQTFGNAANSYVKDIGLIAGATERSKYELLEGTAAIGAMSKSLGMGEQVAANYSAQWAQIAADMSSFYNVPIEGALADIQSAMAGSSEPMLKYGIDTRVAALEQVALAHGLIQAGEQMDKATQAQAVQIAVMEQASDAMGDAQRTADSLSNSIKGIQGSAVDASTDLGMLLIPTAERLVNAFKSILPGLQNVVAGIVLTFRNMVEVGIEFVKMLGEVFGVNFDQLAENSGTWGANISIQLARGISAATVYVVKALSQLAQVITSLLQPHSPPKILPNLDTWGTEAANVWLEGWTEADFGIFDNIANLVTNALKNLGTVTPDMEILSRQAIKETIDAVNELGLSGSQAVDLLQSKIGQLPPELTEYVTTMFNAEAAAQAVANAQQELNDITQAFSDKLAPLNKELADIRDQKQAAKDQQKMADLQDIMSNQFVSAADKEAAALELKELQLQQQIKAIEKEQDVAVDAAKTKLDAAKKEEDRIKEMMKLQELNLKMRDDDNKLIMDQIGIIEELSGGIGSIASGVGSIGSALADIGDIGGLSTAIEGIGAIEPIDFENMFSGLSEQIDAEFEPARQAVEDLGTAFSDLKTTLEGMTLETIVSTLSDKFSEFVDNNRDTAALVSGIGAAFGTWLIIGQIIALGGTLAGLWGTVTAAVTTFGAGVGATGTILGGIVAVLGGPVTAAIIAISALIGLATAAWIGDWGGFRTKILEFVEDIKEGWEAWKGNWENLGIIFKTGIDNIKEWWEGLRLKWDIEVFKMKMKIDDMKEAWENFKSKIDLVVSGVKLILGGLRDKFDEITGNIRGALQPIIDLINTIKDAIASIQMPNFMNGGNNKNANSSFSTLYPSGYGGAGGTMSNSNNRTTTTNIYNINVDKNGEITSGSTRNIDVAMALAGGV